MKFLSRLYQQVKDFCVAYPAVLSGFIIYSYLLLCIIRYFMKAKAFTIHFGDIIESFDAFPFMWFLSVALVKIIEIRTKLQESESKRIVAEQEIQIKQAQLKTVQEITRSVQHHINNPLAIIALATAPARKAAAGNKEINRTLDTIDESVNRITEVLSDFSKIRQYTTEKVDTGAGEISSRGEVKKE